jgi:hypothetical protein
MLDLDSEGNRISIYGFFGMDMLLLTGFNFYFVPVNRVLNIMVL